jgi:serine/threonine protein kinase
LTIVADRYELSKVLGRGSTGTVWEAWDRKSSEAVAVKLFAPGVLESVRGRKRFVREVAIARTVAHRHAVRVRSHGMLPDGGGYLVMERLVGTTLACRLRKTGPLPQPRAIRIVSQILDAVDAAHRLNVVHRDLKPSNVMLVRRRAQADFVKVCDFGLAKAVEDDAPEASPNCDSDFDCFSTERGHICGTPAYMAPEQGRGEPVDGRADLYAIAVVLFEAVIGRLPFSAQSPLAIMGLHLTMPPPRPSVLRPDLAISPALEQLILRGLAKDRTRRPSSAWAFRSELLDIARRLRRGEIRCAVPARLRVPIEIDTLSLVPHSGDKTAA